VTAAAYRAPAIHSPVAMRFLHSAGGWGAFPGRLGGQLLPGRFAAGGFTGSLLGTSHLRSQDLHKTGGEIRKEGATSPASFLPPPPCTE